jgi:hypothetical protein
VAQATPLYKMRVAVNGGARILVQRDQKKILMNKKIKLNTN